MPSNRPIIRPSFVSLQSLWSFPPRPSALTLVELMAALAIASMLTVATFSTVGSLLRARKVGEGALDRSPQSAAWRPVLSRDLLNATEYTATGAGFALRTHAWLDRRTLDSACLDSSVAYEVRRVGERNWLVRTQRSQFGGDFADIVCPDVASIRLAAPSDAAAPGAGTDEAFLAMQGPMLVTLQFDGANRAPMTVFFRKE